MKKSHNRLLDDWDPEHIFRLQTWLQGEIISDLPVFTAGLGSDISRMDLLRSFVEAKLFLGQPIAKNGEFSWSLALVASGYAYGLNRTYDVLPGVATTDGISRSGGDSFGDQFMDAAYMGHGHIGPIKFKGGLLTSKMFTPTVGETDDTAERIPTGEWAFVQLEGYGFDISFRADLLEDARNTIDNFTFDVAVMQALRAFGLQEDLGSSVFPGFELRFEDIKYQRPNTEGYQSTDFDYSRDEDFIIGFKLQQSLWAFAVDDSERWNHHEGGKFEGGPLWMSLQMDVATNAGIMRDFIFELGFSTLGPADIKAHKRLSTNLGNPEKMTYGFRGRLGFSTFTDPVALPYLMMGDDPYDPNNDTAMGWDADLFFSMAMPKYGLVWDIAARYRRNWANDLVTVAEFVDIDIFYFGLGFSYGL